MIQAKTALQKDIQLIKRDDIRNVAIIAYPFSQGFGVGFPVCLRTLVPLPTLCQ